MKFRRKVGDVFEAEQWDGTWEQALDIVQRANGKIELWCEEGALIWAIVEAP